MAATAHALRELRAISEQPEQVEQESLEHHGRPAGRLQLIQDLGQQLIEMRGGLVVFDAQGHGLHRGRRQGDPVEVLAQDADAGGRRANSLTLWSVLFGRSKYTRRPWREELDASRRTCFGCAGRPPPRRGPFPAVGV